LESYESNHRAMNHPFGITKDQQKPAETCLFVTKSKAEIRKAPPSSWLPLNLFYQNKPIDNPQCICQSWNKMDALIKLINRQNLHFQKNQTAIYFLKDISMKKYIVLFLIVLFSLQSSFMLSMDDHDYKYSDQEYYDDSDFSDKKNNTLKTPIYCTEFEDPAYLCTECENPCPWSFRFYHKKRCILGNYEGVKRKITPVANLKVPVGPNKRVIQTKKKLQRDLNRFCRKGKIKDASLNKFISKQRRELKKEIKKALHKQQKPQPLAHTTQKIIHSKSKKTQSLQRNTFFQSSFYFPAQIIFLPLRPPIQNPKYFLPLSTQDMLKLGIQKNNGVKRREKEKHAFKRARQILQRELLTTHRVLDQAKPKLFQKAPFGRLPLKLRKITRNISL